MDIEKGYYIINMYFLKIKHSHIIKNINDNIVLEKIMFYKNTVYIWNTLNQLLNVS